MKNMKTVKIIRFSNNAFKKTKQGHLPFHVVGCHVFIEQVSQWLLTGKFSSPNEKVHTKYIPEDQEIYARNIIAVIQDNGFGYMKLHEIPFDDSLPITAWIKVPAWFVAENAKVAIQSGEEPDFCTEAILF